MSRSLSRSKVELFLHCPRCFWLDVKAGVKQPPGFPFNLNSAVDHLLKNEFDRYRGGTTVPPRLAREGLSFIPAAHPELQQWRHNFTGVRVEHGPTGLTLFGAIDDLWADAGGTDGCFWPTAVPRSMWVGPRKAGRKARHPGRDHFLPLPLLFPFPSFA